MDDQATDVAGVTFLERPYRADDQPPVHKLEYQPVPKLGTEFIERLGQRWEPVVAIKFSLVAEGEPLEIQDSLGVFGGGHGDNHRFSPSRGEPVQVASLSLKPEGWSRSWHLF